MVPFPKRTRHADHTPCLNSSSRASSGILTSLFAPAATFFLLYYVPVENLDISTRDLHPRSPSMLDHPSTGATYVLTEKRMPVLYQFVQVAIGDLRNVFSLASSDLSRRARHFLLAYENRID